MTSRCEWLEKSLFICLIWIRIISPLFQLDLVYMAFRDLRMFSSFFYIIKRSDAWLFGVCGQRRIQDISIRGPDFVIRKKIWFKQWLNNDRDEIGNILLKHVYTSLYLCSNRRPGTLHLDPHMVVYILVCEFNLSIGHVVGLFLSCLFELICFN